MTTICICLHSFTGEMTRAASSRSSRYKQAVLVCNFKIKSLVFSDDLEVNRGSEVFLSKGLVVQTGKLVSGGRKKSEQDADQVSRGSQIGSSYLQLKKELIYMKMSHFLKHRG